MFRIIGSRAIGKTYNLFMQVIEFHRANPEAKIIFVCASDPVFIEEKWLKESGYDKDSLNWIEFVPCNKLLSCLGKKAYLFIDELDDCLKYCNVLGYSTTLEK